MDQSNVVDAEGLNMPSIAKALAQFQGKVRNPERNREVKVRGETKQGKKYDYTFKYATLDHIIDTIKEPLAECGLSFMQELEDGKDGLRILTTIMHASGDHRTSGWTIPMSQDRTLQGVGSAISYARRYALTAALGIASEDDTDGGGDSGGTDVRSREDPAVAQAAEEVKAAKVNAANAWRFAIRHAHSEDALDELQASREYKASMKTFTDVARSALLDLIADRREIISKNESGTKYPGMEEEGG